MPTWRDMASKVFRVRRLADRAMLFAAGLVSISATVAVVAPALLSDSAAPLAIGFTTLALVLVAAYATRGALQPLELLAEQTERLCDATPADSDEISRLARAIAAIAARLEKTARQARVALVDQATRIPNQDWLLHEVNTFISEAGPDDTGAVIVVELERLPRLTQTLAPEIARELLRTVAAQALRSVRMLDNHFRPDAQPAVVARISDSEFGIFAAGLSTLGAGQFAAHLNALLRKPIELRDSKFSLEARSGVAIAPRDGLQAEICVRHARLALAYARSAQAAARVFSPAMDREIAQRMTLERELRQGLENKEFRAFFQPKVSFASGKIEGCEALARWIRPDRTMVSPARFIPLAEECGLIGALSDAILSEACWSAASWAHAGFEMRVAVNISALQFRDEGFAARVLDMVSESGLSPRQLELEITESVLMEEPERALRAIRPLREAGIRFAIDDFGCGHSSLAALSQLPFDVIKIDQQFVRSIGIGDTQAAAIAEMIVALGQALKLEIVAEGVERIEQAEFMAGKGCHLAQGFLYGAASAEQEFIDLLRRQQKWTAHAANAA